MLHEIVQKVVKLKASKRYCPQCKQEKNVLNRGGHKFSYHESLECGHTVLIYRETKGGKFHWWRLTAKETIKANA